MCEGNKPKKIREEFLNQASRLLQIEELREKASLVAKNMVTRLACFIFAQLWQILFKSYIAPDADGCKFHQHGLIPHVCLAQRFLLHSRP